MSAHAEHDALLAYLDGALPPAEAAALDARLRTEPGLADELIRLAREDAIGREWAASAAATAAETIAPTVAPAPRRGRGVRAAALTVLALSAVALIAMLGWPGRSSAPVVATLEDVQGEVFVIAPDGTATAARDGQTLLAGHEVHTGEDDSTTVVRIDDSRLVMAPETRLRIDPQAGGPMVYVPEGMVDAEVTRKPLLLHGSFAELRGTAGRFSFVSLPDATLVEADAGSGRLTRHSDGRAVNVARGQSAVVRAGGGPLRAAQQVARVSESRRTLNAGGPVRGLVFESGGDSIVTCTPDAVKRFAIGGGGAGQTLFAAKKRTMRALAADRGNQLRAVIADERLVRLLGPDAGEGKAFHGTKRAAAIALTPDGHFLAVSWVAPKAPEVRLYDTTLGQERVLHSGHAGGVTALAYSPRGDLLATAGADRTVRVWSAIDLAPIRVLPKSAADARVLAFSPDGRFVAAGERQGQVVVYEVATGSIRHILTGHLRDVTALAFAPHGRSLASVSLDGTCRVWHLPSGAELECFRGHGGAVLSVAYSPDGRQIATGGQDRRVLLWDVPASAK